MLFTTIKYTRQKLSASSTEQASDNHLQTENKSVTASAIAIVRLLAPEVRIQLRIFFGGGGVASPARSL